MAASHLLVGAGKMGGALLNGWLESGLVTPRKLAILDPSPGPEAIFAIERGAKHITKAQDIPKSVQTVLLAVLRPGGEVVRVDSEAALNAVTAISGSGPAYVFHLVEALEAGAIALDLPPEVAAKLARETLIGAAKLLESSDEGPDILRKNVTSPNGTTQAALDVLMGEDGGLSKMMIATVRAAFARAKELAG